MPNHLRNASVRRTWYLMHRWMEGTIYDDISHPFHKDHDSRGRYVEIEKRRPTTQWNLPAITATQVARKLMAGRHAPTFKQPDHPEFIQKVNDLIDESGFEEQMKLTIERGQAGASVLTYKFLKNLEGKLVLITDVYHAHECWANFNATKDLTNLRICRVTMGSYFIDHGLNYDNEGEKINPDGQYWFIKDLDTKEEIHYYPPPINGFRPDAQGEAKLHRITIGTFAAREHGLDGVPAHWFWNIGGGVCIFEKALKNVTAYDFLMSQMLLGTMLAATPHVVIKGSPVVQKGEDGKDIALSPAKYLQFQTGRKDDTVTIDGGDAKLLEPTGQGMAVGVDKVGRGVKKDAIEIIGLSRKDPDKVTTAMSGKGMETIEEEFMDLIMDLRTCWLKNGYLVVMRKIIKAAKKCNHPDFADVTDLMLKNLRMDYPQLHEMTPQEMQMFIQALAEGTDIGILDGADAHDLLEAQLDTTRNTSREEVKARVEKIRQDNLKSNTPQPAKSKAVAKTKAKTESKGS